MTAACARPPARVTCAATASTFDLFRPDKKTSAPSDANSFATAAPIEPPAPNTIARFPCKNGELFITPSLEPLAAFFLHLHDVEVIPLGSFDTGPPQNRFIERRIPTRV